MYIFKYKNSCYKYLSIKYIIYYLIVEIVISIIINIKFSSYIIYCLSHILFHYIKKIIYFNKLGTSTLKS